MKTQEMEITGQTVINIVLEEDIESLEEVVVTGYGNFKKASFTGSANIVSAEKMRDIPVINIAQKLQGQTAGVFISATSGQPGAIGEIRIRGMGSFTATNQPLFIVDGIPVNTGSMVNASGYMTQAKTDVMSTINPNDIENITVIKDAAAASLYGSRAANGVILITTKRGKTGDTKVDITVSGGISNLAMENRPMVSGEQRRELVYESLYNQAIDNGESDPNTYADSYIEDYAPEPWSGYTNWEDYLLRKNAYSQNYSASISGGDEKSKFLASIGKMNTEGIAINSDFERYSANLSYDRKFSEKLNFTGKMVLSKITQNLNEERGTLAGPYFLLGGYITPSEYPYNEDGSYNYDHIYTSSTYNVIETMTTDINRATITRMMTSGSVGYEIFDGLEIKENLNYDFTNQKDIVYYCPYSGAGPKSAASGTAEAWKAFAEQSRIFSSTSLGYIKTFNDEHNVDILAAYEVEEYNQDYILVKGNTIASDELTDIGVTSVTSSVSSLPQSYRLISYVTRLNYDYEGKYYFGASFRRDGTSRLSESQRWGNFWSLSGMWRLIEEPFVEGLKSTFSDLKFRTSYGVNGNLPSSNWAYRGLYSYTLAYMGNSGSYESSLQNDDLKWEKNYNLNIGLDFTLYDRVSVTAEYYSRQTKDLIYSMPLSYTSGFGSKLTNIGHISNKGFELSFTTTNINKGDFTWTTDLSFAHNKNVIKKINDEVDYTTASNRITMYIRKIGGSFYEFYLKEFAGVDPDNGDALYYVNTTDEDGNITDHTTTTNDASDANVVDVGKHAMPNLTSNMTNTFYYKNFDFSFTFTGAWGGYTFDYMAEYTDIDGTNLKRNFRDYTINRWQEVGDETDIPRLSYANSSGPSNSTRFLHSNDYIRLKSLTFGYTLPDKITRKAKMDKVRFYLSGANLLTHAAYDKYDPETEMGGFSWASAPTTKNITIGANISF
jgi:TonB-linked SusC/RagA family outer membrane protein